jgi:hypothetical protein
VKSDRTCNERTVNLSSESENRPRWREWRVSDVEAQRMNKVSTERPDGKVCIKRHPRSLTQPSNASDKLPAGIFEAVQPPHSKTRSIELHDEIQLDSRRRDLVTIRGRGETLERCEHQSSATAEQSAAN